MICLLHYEHRPCNQCAIDAYLRRVLPRAESSVRAPAVITFKPITLDHMYSPWETPRQFDTPRELRAETQRRGVTSEYLRDSSLWRSRDPSW